MIVYEKNLIFRTKGATTGPTEEQLAKINQFTLVPHTAEQVYVRKMLLAHNCVDRDLERFPEPLLDDFAATLPGKSLLFGHRRPEPGKGLFFDAYTEEISPQQFFEMTGEEPWLPDGVEKVKVLWGWVYIPKTPSNEEIIANIDAGIYRHVSIGFRAADQKRVEDKQGRLLFYEYVPPGEALEGSIVWLGAQPGATFQKAAVRFESTPTADEGRGWDGDAAVKRLRKWASSDGSGDKDKIDWAKYRRGFAWYDSENPENFGSYKLEHHDVENGKLVVVWRGVAAAMAALMGARGGVNIPESDFDGVYSHLAKHYRQFDREPPEKKEVYEGFRKALEQSQKGGKTMEVLKQLSEELQKEFNEVSDVVNHIKALQKKISELEPLAEDGKKWRQSLVEEYVTLRTKLNEIPPDDETKQKQAREIAAGFPIEFLKSEIDVLKKRVEKEYPAEGQLKGNDPDAERGKKDKKDDNPLIPKETEEKEE